MTGEAPSVLVTILLGLVPSSIPAASISIGTQKQLFVDLYIVDSLDNAHQVLNRPVKEASNPILRPDRPWEHNVLVGFGSAVFDVQESLFKMWYLDWNQPWGGPNSKYEGQLCYATSRDGVVWEKPALHAIAAAGSNASNVVLRAKGDGTIDSGNVIKDLHERDPEKRYKLLCWYSDHKTGLFVAFSRDGIHWNEYPSNPAATASELGIDDTVTVLGFDQAVQKYVAYMKVLCKTPELRRIIGYSTSNDFIHWKKPKVIIAPDERDSKATQFYKMPVIQYEGTYIGMLYVYHQGGHGLPGSKDSSGDDTIDAQLATSRDGISWERQFREPFIPVGKQGAFDSGMIFGSMPVVARDQIFFYYGGFDHPHMSLDNHASIGLARLRLDGFVSIEPRESQGATTTKVLQFAGRRLEVNASAKGGGRLTVEVLDASGEPLKGYAETDNDPLREDRLHHTVTWKGRSDVSSLQGKPIRLRFRLQRAKLYAFQFLQ